MQTDQHIDLAALTELARNDSRVDVLWLYGSRAKGTAEPESDWDLAVAFNRFPESPLEQRLQPELLALHWAETLGVSSDRISVIDINHVPLPLAYAAVTSGKVLLAKDALRLAREELRVTSMWELDHEYHRRSYG